MLRARLGQFVAAGRHQHCRPLLFAIPEAVTWQRHVQKCRCVGDGAHIVHDDELLKPHAYRGSSRQPVHRALVDGREILYA